MDNLQIFNYGEIPVRTVLLDGEPWWVLADVCRVLGIKNSRDVVNRLDPDEKGVGQIDTPGGNQNMTIINESGLYKVILRSDKLEAKPFTRWVTHEVLPAIRKTGALTVEKGSKYGWHITKLSPEGEAFVKSLGKNGFSLVRPKVPSLKGSSKSGSSSRKYVCPCCGTIIRATKEVHVICGECEVPFEEQE